MTTAINRQKLNETGMVSIIVTFILMIVISITVLGFSQVVRRSGRQALDAQLSSQALYAAETGVNDAVYAMSQQPGTTNFNKDECTEPLGTVTLTGVVDPSTSTSYTCLLVDSQPGELVYDMAPNDPAKVIPLRAASGTFIDIELEWTPSGNAALVNNCNQNDNTTAANWTCPFGLVRVDLLPESAITSGNRNTLLASTFTSFIYPWSNGGATTNFFSALDNVYGAGIRANQGGKLLANCGGGTCKATITGLTQASYYMRVSVLYSLTTLTIRGHLSGGGNPPAEFAGGQVVIDATGKSQDVLRRIQVRKPSYGTGSAPNYALQTYNSLCKQFTVGRDAVTNNPLPYNYSSNCN